MVGRIFFGENLVVHASGFCFGFERKQSRRLGVAAPVAEGASLSVEPVKELQERLVHFGVGGELLAARLRLEGRLRRVQSCHSILSKSSATDIFALTRLRQALRLIFCAA